MPETLPTDNTPPEILLFKHPNISYLQWCELSGMNYFKTYPVLKRGKITPEIREGLRNGAVKLADYYMQLAGLCHKYLADTATPPEV